MNPNTIKSVTPALSYILWVLILIIAGCSSDEDAAGNDRATDFTRVLITDRNGVQWDVTHAWETYRMQPAFFNFGLGVGAIPSVDNPIVVIAADANYPDPTNQMQVFGVVHNGQARAYAVSILTAHEVINDFFAGDTDPYVSVTF